MAPTPAEFEENVRRVARALWPTAEHGGAEMVQFNGVEREVDGVFRTEEVIHMVEASMDQRIDKAHNVGPKLRQHLARNKGRGLFAKAWFITYHPPTAHQRQELHKYDKSIQALSFDQFKAKLIDARQYSDLREKVEWGSAVNPKDNSRTNLVRYVPIGLSVLVADSGWRSGGKAKRTAYQRTSRSGMINLTVLTEEMEAGSRVALVGDYGAGKSMTIRELHNRLMSAYLNGDSLRFPMTLSLRRHYGQDDPAEAILRHARYIGYPEPHKLVRAWRAGYVHMLLDGFDELAAPGWSGSPDSLRENRRTATALVKEFSEQSPRECGLIVAGRRHYFDSLDELGFSLFGHNEEHVVVSLSDFTDAQAAEFLTYFNSTYVIPPWLPAKPLLLGYLAAEGLVDDMEGGLKLSPAEGWDWLLDQISERESFIRQGVDGPAVRSVIEKLAAMARQTPQGIGPVRMNEVVEAFTIVRRQPPSDKELTLLQRLPGLGGEEDDSETGTRRFIDVDLASAAQAASVTSYITDAYDEQVGINPTKWSSSFEPLGVEVCAFQSESLGIEEGQIKAALRRAISLDRYELVADLVRVCISRGIDLSSSTDSNGFQIFGAVIPRFELDEVGADLSAVSFIDCMFNELEFSGDSDHTRLPHFRECYFASVIGRLGEDDLPRGFFVDCEFEEFPEGAERNSEILDVKHLKPGTRVVMTLLRKLYLQRGSGRKDSALTRGMNPQDARLVPSALRLLQQEGLVAPIRHGKSKIWLPDRSSGPRVRAFLRSPRSGDDPLGEASSHLQ